MSAAAAPLLVDPAALARTDPAQVLVLDCRFSLAAPAAGRTAWRAAHIPGACYAHLDEDLSGPRTDPRLGRHPLPDAARFAAALGRWGWHAGQTIIAADDAGGAIAARAWWLALLAGIPAQLLDGGWGAWRDAGQPRESGAPERRAAAAPPLHFDLRRVITSAAQLRAELGRGALLLDARAAERYRGEHEPIDPVAGHVPGARSRPLAENLAAEGQRFKPAARLRAEFLALLGATPPARVIHMCGSGVTACHNLFAMELAGLTGSRLFAPSWSGWSSDPENAVARGPDPG